MLNKIRENSTHDPQLKLTTFYTQNGWPRCYEDLPHGMNDYYSERGLLSVTDGILTYADRVVIPKSMRREVLERIHEGHQGIVKCRERVKTSVWWPGITVDVKKMVAGCTHCQENRPSQRREPLIPTPLPTGPWERIGADLCEYKGQKYLVVVDCYSRYIELVHLPTTTSKFVINKLKALFARHGLPRTMMTDNGPQFSGAEFHQFMEYCGTEHVTSSPHFPQANREAKRAVQTAKKLLAQEDPAFALLNYRTTPHSATGYSPAQLLMGRQLRTRVPVLPKTLIPKWPNTGEVRRNDELAKTSYKYYYDKRHGARPLTTLAPGDRVKIDETKQWSSPKEVIAAHGSPRSYLVKGNQGQALRRNRCHLQQMPEGNVGDHDTVSLGEPLVREFSPNIDTEVPVAPSPLSKTKQVAPDTPKVTTKSGRVVKPVTKLNL